MPDSAYSTKEKPTTSPDDSPQRLKRFQEESGLSWAEIARRIGTYPHTVWLWKEGKSRPNQHHMKGVARSGGLPSASVHLFTD